MATPLGGTHHGFINTSKVRQTGVDWPDIQMYFFITSVYSNYGKDLSWMFSLDPKHINSLMEPLQGKNSFGMGTVLVRPKSVGEIRLRNSNPFSKPIIDPHYLEHPDDVQALREGTAQKF